MTKPFEGHTPGPRCKCGKGQDHVGPHDARHLEREAFEALWEALALTYAALKSYHDATGRGEGLAKPMMDQARAALALADKVSKP